MNSHASRPDKKIARGADEVGHPLRQKVNAGKSPDLGMRGALLVDIKEGGAVLDTTGSFETYLDGIGAEARHQVLGQMRWEERLCISPLPEAERVHLQPTILGKLPGIGLSLQQAEVEVDPTVHLRRAYGHLCEDCFESKL